METSSNSIIFENEYSPFPIVEKYPLFNNYIFNGDPVQLNKLLTIILFFRQKNNFYINIENEAFYKNIENLDILMISLFQDDDYLELLKSSIYISMLIISNVDEITDVHKAKIIKGILKYGILE